MRGKTFWAASLQCQVYCLNNKHFSRMLFDFLNLILHRCFIWSRKLYISLIVFINFSISWCLLSFLTSLSSIILLRYAARPAYGLGFSVHSHLSFPLQYSGKHLECHTSPLSNEQCFILFILLERCIFN